MAKKKLLEQTIEDELREIGTGRNLTLSELRLAIVRVTENEPTALRRNRKTREFLGMLAEQLELPGLFTLPNGRFFVYKNGNRYVAKDASPEYITSEEAQPVADRDLIPEMARRRLEEAGIVSGARTSPVDPPPEITATPLPPADRGQGAEVPASQPSPTASGSALTRFASSGKGGLRNDPDEVEAIRELQTFLTNDLGLDTGGIDGRYGRRTTAAVRRFQGALTDVVQDGDAGPETIGKIQELRRDTQRMQELIGILNDSALPVVFKSGLAKLLERELTQEERTELQQLLDKYENFRQTFPEFQTTLFSNAENALTGATDTAPRTYNANTPVEDLKLPVEGGEAQRAAAEEYNRLIDEGNFEEAANALRDNEALGIVPQGLETEVRRRATSAAPASSGPTTRPNNAPSTGDSAADVAQDDAARTATPPAATSTAGPATSQPVRYGNDFTENLTAYITRTNRSPEETRRLIDSINLTNFNTTQLTDLRRIVIDLPLKLVRGDRVYSIDGNNVNVTIEPGTRQPESANIVRDWIRGTLDPAIERLRNPEPPPPAAGTTITPEARSKADTLYRAMAGIGVDRQTVTQTMLSIQSAEEYQQVDAAFRELSDNESLWSFIDSQSFFSTVRIQDHLRQLNVRFESDLTRIINITNRLLER